MKIKVVLYNILNGFCNDNPPFQIDQKRMNNALKIIAKQKPDILILTEAYFWPFTKKADLKKLKETFKGLYNEYTYLAKSYFRWAPIILSKYPVINFDITLSEHQLNFMSANIQVGKKQLTLDVFHPHPDKTEQQKSEFLKSRINKNQNYLLAGDFNAISFQDGYNIPKLIKGYESFMKTNGKDKAENMLKFLTTKTVASKGLIDTYKIKNPDKFSYTIPTDLRSKNKDSAIRIDYIFCSKDFKILESDIIKESLTEKASDHYPVYALLEI